MAVLFLGPAKIVQGAEWNELRGYVIDIQDYSKELSDVWPDAIVRPPSTSFRSLEWKLVTKANPSGGLVALSDDQKFITIENVPKDDVIDFVLWHRAYIPSEFPLYLFDEGLNLNIEVTGDVTRTQLESIF